MVAVGRKKRKIDILFIGFCGKFRLSDTLITAARKGGMDTAFVLGTRSA
jgi:hypothetical protein